MFFFSDHTTIIDVIHFARLNNIVYNAMRDPLVLSLSDTSGDKMTLRCGSESRALVWEFVLGCMRDLAADAAKRTLRLYENEVRLLQ